MTGSVIIQIDLHEEVAMGNIPIDALVHLLCNVSPNPEKNLDPHSIQYLRNLLEKIDARDY